MDEKLISDILKKKQKEILIEIDRVCKKNNIGYCLAWGSCLGAIRHNGFIPWDDDIDIFMSAEDLEKFKKLQSEFSKEYFIQTNRTDKEYGLMITRVRNSNTTFIEDTEINRDINHGIFLDIYPLFNSYGSKLKNRKYVFISLLYRLMLYNRVPRNRGKIMKIGSTILLLMTPKFIKRYVINNFYSKLLKIKDTDYVSTYYGNHVKVSFPKNDIYPFTTHKFEDLCVPVPANCDNYLRRAYGDYMKLPPVDNRKFHHNFAQLDENKSYLEYKGIKYCVK